jgi:hypothetical protein
MGCGRAPDERRRRQTAHQAVGLLIDFRLVRLAVSALVLMVGMVMGAMAQATPEGAMMANQPIFFDIPSQPLATALESYSSATGREVLYNTNLIRDHKSRSLEGVLNADVALERLLDGSGLSPRYLADQSFVLLPTPEAAPPDRAGASPALIDRYYALIQESLRNALCTNDTARPGGYRVAALLWIGASGTVVRHERLDALSARDAGAATETNERIDQTLDHLAIGEPPPVGFAQPVTIAVVPQADGVTMGCPSRSDDRAVSWSRHG